MSERETFDKNGAAEIVRQHRRQIELSPGVGEAAQRYGLAVCDDILNDLARSAIGETHTDHPARHWDRTCPACVSEIARTCPKCGETKPCGFQGCHMESALSATATTSSLVQALEDQRDAWTDTRDNPAADKWHRGFAQQQIDAINRVLTKRSSSDSRVRDE